LRTYARSFGSYIHSYFDGVCYQVSYQFQKDDLVVEGFTEAVKEIVIEVVQETKKGLKNSYHEYEIKDEKLMCVLPALQGFGLMLDLASAPPRGTGELTPLTFVRS
jgi:hypothetical protein